MFDGIATEIDIEIWLKPRDEDFQYRSLAQSMTLLSMNLQAMFLGS